MCSQIGRLNIVVMSVLLELIYRFNAISIKTPVCFLYINHQADFKIYVESQRPRMVKTIFKKNTVGRPVLPEKTYYKVTMIKNGVLLAPK